jgi:hypothetical protein
VKALDHQHTRLVALKLRPVGSDRGRDELLREARVLLALTPHPSLPLVREDFFDGEAVRRGDGLGRWHRSREAAPRQGHARASPLERPRLPRRGRRGAELPLRPRPAGRPPRRQTGEPDPHPRRSREGRRLRTLLGAGDGGEADGHRRVPGSGARGGSAAVARERRLRCSPRPPLPCSRGRRPRASYRSGRASMPRSPRVWRRRSRRGLRRIPRAARGRPASSSRLRAGWASDLPTGVITFCMSDIEGSTSLWDAAGREPADLYRGTRLDAAAEWARANSTLLNRTERDFLNAGVDESARAQRRQLRANRRLRRALTAGAARPAARPRGASRCAHARGRTGRLRGARRQHGALPAPRLRSPGLPDRQFPLPLRPRPDRRRQHVRR